MLLLRLRGGKAELWEGGVKGACFLYGGALPTAAAGLRSSALVAAVDWYPTLLSLAGVEMPHELGSKLYGVSVRKLLEGPRDVQKYELRNELLHNADELTNRAAIRVGDLKLVSCHVTTLTCSACARRS